MNKSPERMMKDAASVFRSRARHSDKTDPDSARRLTDNYYVLEQRTAQVIKEIRHIKGHFKGPEAFPGLFEKCRELCEGGVLPCEKDIIEFFEKSGGISGIGLRLLPLAVTCALISHASDGVKSGGHKGSGQLANAVSSLRKISETDFEKITEKLFSAEEILMRDKDYPFMDEYSKNVYRERVAELAAAKKKSETEIAREAAEKTVKKGCHIGEYLFSGKKKTKNGYLYLAMELIMPAAVSFCLSVFLKSITVGLLTFIPLWEILRYPIEAASLRTAKPKKHLRLSEKCEKVKNVHALVTVSTILPDANKMKELGEHLEQLYLSNCTENIKLCCLADLKAAGMPRKPEDKAVIKAAKETVDRLNAAYHGGFILAIRPRVHSVTQNEFIGRERKRGAITELIRAIKGNRKGFSVLHGDTDELEKVKYLIALDADTQPVFDSARELICVAEHPLNRPVIVNGRVVRGYGILAPKTENTLESKNSTVFGRLMAGDSGISAYDNAVSERYQDLFGEGIFCGKGLIDVDSYHSLLGKGLPQEKILSHDIVESGYLRTGYVPEIVITEGMPQSVLPYYRRLHRWVRGDWQNIGFIFGRNPLNFLSRYKMLDNLRRSITPVAAVFSAAVSMFTEDYEAVCITLCSMAAFGARYLYPAFSSLLSGGLSSLTRLYFSKALPPALHFFARSFAAVAFSVREALVCADAIVKSLWRLFISKKKLLEWTTAAQSEKNGSIKATLISCVPSMIAAFLLLVFGNSLHRLLGLIILADVPLALVASSKIDFIPPEATENQKETVVSYASAMWGFFEKLCGKENNFLPPDNIQFSPVKATASRTSPTNIGLMLASFLSARDMGFITTAELYMRMNLSLTSIEKLEKYKGNLLNWYSTQTLQPLQPRFVSTVDSGNFLCCLTAVKEGLREYATECPPLNGIIGRLEKIISETELSPFYNEQRQLFHIGINPDSGEKSNSFYDLYMSEARMTSYFAVARGDVPKKHWGALGRLTVASGRYTGLASWTGTMFEYFMPNLFIPSPVGSLSREALSFCLFCQRKRTGRMPFGISESGFYSFDRDLNYQYKAHGVRKLALSHGKNDGPVISPYSTFLVLPDAPKAALKNFRKLEKLGMLGIYGFYEAIDFTKGRGSAGPSAVRSYMSHHVGMSMVAADNFLFGNIMQKRFMNDRIMRRASSLLDEKIQTDSSVFRGIRTDEIKNIRERVHGNASVYGDPDPFNREAMLLSNGRMTTCITDCGTGVTLFDGLDITVNSTDSFMRPQGIFGVFAGEKEVVPFVRALDKASSAAYSAAFSRNKAVHTAKKDSIQLKMETVLLRKLNCELRSFTVENLSRKDALIGNLLIYFEPCIEKRKAYASHPMFSKLFLVDEKDDENRCVLFSRRSSADGNEVGAAVGLIENIDYECETSRERVLKSPEGIFSLGRIIMPGSDRGNPDCCAAFFVKINLGPGKKQTVTMAVSAGENKEQALNGLLAVRAGKSVKQRSENPFFGDSTEARLASGLLPSMLFPPLASGMIKTGEKSVFTKNDLWSLGISGENPVIVVETDGEENAGEIIPYIRINKELRNRGIKTDLAVVFGGEEKYFLPITNAVKRIAENEDCGLMLGVNGGIHVIDKTLFDYAAMTALENTASVYIREGKTAEKTEKSRFRPIKLVCEKENKSVTKKARHVKQYNFTEGKITVKKTPETLDIPWCYVLSNQSFGTMVSDKVLGFTWALNSRENKLTPWYNDLMSDNRGELLIVKYNGVLYDLAAMGDAEFTPDCASWKVKISGVEFTAKVTVPQKGTVKKCTVEFTNNSDSIRNFDIMYFTLPVLGVSRDECGMLYASKSDCGVTVENPFSEIHGCSYLGCSCKADYICLSKKNFFEGNFSSPDGEITNDCCVSLGRNYVLKKGEKASLEFYLSWAATERAAKEMPAVSPFGGRMLNPLKISSKNKNLDLFFNSFLYSQIKQTRFWGRTGFYQCSGAYGFRDQLQDSLAFIDFEPQLTLAHIARCASVQFEEGDVLHWWHVITNKKQQIRGIRTRCSDDMLWLPYVCIKYRQKTGDTDFLDIRTPFLQGETLAEDENERYSVFERSDCRESILVHCIKAVDKSLNYGKNGFPLIGSCDWNDGFSRIGEENAESVWLAMFQIIVLDGMAELCEEKNLTEKGSEYRKTAERLRNLTEEKAWCSDRYARIILENGEPFGKDRDFIDILPQAFAVFAGLGKNGRADKALSTAVEKLCDGKTLRLLSPAFDEDECRRIGYIASYPCGIRENSGQYTHAAVWLAQALMMNKRSEEAEKVINLLNPLSFYGDESNAARYRAEPYVLAGDVSAGDSVSGRAGWTHFTGSASWFYRCVYENAQLLNCSTENNTVKHRDFTNAKKHEKQ
ncbi:MAG: DUF3131 domain-containing protein [Clostridia bacterium]|nr:DUF3131 domain-containing protein [Clostridia bacterium]